MSMQLLRDVDEQFGVAGGSGSLLQLLAEVKAVIETLEGTHSREEIVAAMPNIRAVAAMSPFVVRAQTWPKGYQGDFETIGHIIAQQNRAEPGTTGHMVEDFFLASDICRQHNNKVACQAALIAEAIQRKGGAALLSIGCGTSADVSANIQGIRTSQARITLVDIDTDAIAHSLAALQAIHDQVTVIPGNIYKIVKTLKDRYDLVIIGGVFDYLSDKVIISILRSLKELLHAGGKIFFTNIKAGNPYRIYMEYLADWVLIERSEEDIRRLLLHSGCGDMPATIATDATSLTYMVELAVPV